MSFPDYCSLDKKQCSAIHTDASGHCKFLQIWIMLFNKRALGRVYKKIADLHC